MFLFLYTRDLGVYNDFTLPSWSEWDIEIERARMLKGRTALLSECRDIDDRFWRTHRSKSVNRKILRKEILK